MPDFQGAVGLRKICRIFLLYGGGRKVTGEGCNRASLCHSFTECPPLLIYTLRFPVGWPSGRGRFQPHPKVHTGNAKSGVERKYSTPPEKLERNTIGPISPPFALAKRAVSGYNKATVQSI